MKRAALLMHSRTALLILAEIFVGIVSSLALAASFIDLSTEIADKNVLFYDQLLSRFIYSYRSPVLTSIMMFITDLGADYILIGVAACVIFLIWKKHKKEALLFLIITLMGLIINVALKQLVARPRPMISPLISITNYSYPSGHAMNSFIFYTTLAFYFFRFTRRKILSLVISFISILLILLIGFSRVYLGVHYPTDILAGYFVGLWWFISAIVIEKTMVFRKLFKEIETD